MICDKIKLAEIYRQHYDEIRRFIARKLPGCDSADLTQEVFLRVLCAGDGYEIQQPRSFLFKIASNIALDHLRSSRNRIPHLTIEETVEPVAASTTNPEMIVSAQQRLTTLQMAIEELPPRCKTVFTLHRFGNLSHGQIAEKLEISVNMVEKHIIKALAHCRMRLNETDRQKTNT